MNIKRARHELYRKRYEIEGRMQELGDAPGAPSREEEQEYDRLVEQRAMIDLIMQVLDDLAEPEG